MSEHRSKRPFVPRMVRALAIPIIVCWALIAVTTNTFVPQVEKVAEELLPADEAVVVLVGYLHDLDDLVPVAVHAVLLQDAVVLVHGQQPVAVHVRALKCSV